MQEPPDCGEEEAACRQRIKEKTQQLKDLVLRQIAFKNLVERNRRVGAQWNGQLLGWVSVAEIWDAQPKPPVFARNRRWSRSRLRCVRLRIIDGKDNALSGVVSLVIGVMEYEKLTFRFYSFILYIVHLFYITCCVVVSSLAKVRAMFGIVWCSGGEQ